MTTAEEYMDLSDKSYLVDPLKRKPPLAQGERVVARSGSNLQKYEVLDVQDNPVNGFQAMAVAPVVNGKVDTSRVVISYAGTNPEHHADVVTDVQSVLDDQQLIGTQVVDAKLFAARVQKKYEGTDIHFTGHSLGGFLGLLVAAETGRPATTFNAPDPWNLLSDATKKRIEADRKAGRLNLQNYVNIWDVIGNLHPNRTGAAIYVNDRPGRQLLDYHNISNRESLDVNPDGSIKGAGVKGHTLEEIVEMHLNSMVPGMGEVMRPALGAVVATVRNPAFASMAAKNITGLIVTVNTVSVVALAASVAATAGALAEIKLANGRLIPSMEEGLNAAKTAALMLPTITTHDIEACVDLNRLHVHQNVDEGAVREVDRLVDRHIERVQDISQGLLRMVEHTVAQDGQWALTYGTH